MITTWLPHGDWTDQLKIINLSGVCVLFLGPIPVAPRGTGTGPAAYIEDFVPEGDVDSFLEYGEAEEEEEEDGGGEEER